MLAALSISCSLVTWDRGLPRVIKNNIFKGLLKIPKYASETIWHTGPKIFTIRISRESARWPQNHVESTNKELTHLWLLPRSTLSCFERLELGDWTKHADYDLLKGEGAQATYRGRQVSLSVICAPTLGKCNQLTHLDRRHCFNKPTQRKQRDKIYYLQIPEAGGVVGVMSWGKGSPLSQVTNEQEIESAASIDPL